MGKKKKKKKKYRVSTTIQKSSSIAVLFYGFGATNEVVNTCIENILEQTFSNLKVYALVGDITDDLIQSEKVSYTLCGGNMLEEFTKIRESVTEDLIAYRTPSTDWYPNHLFALSEALGSDQWITTNVELRDINRTNSPQFSCMNWRTGSFEEVTIDEILHRRTLLVNWASGIVNGHFNPIVALKKVYSKELVSGEITLIQYADPSRGGLIFPIVNVSKAEPPKDIGLVSVIVPVIGSKNSVENALECILNQTYKNVEIIVVGRVNSPLSIMPGLQSQPNITPIIVNNIDFVSGLLQVALQNTKGQYVFYLDPKDHWYPRHIEAHLFVYQAEKEISWQVSAVQQELEDERYYIQPLNLIDPRNFLLSGFTHKRDLQFQWREWKTVNSLFDIVDFGGTVANLNRIKHVTINEVTVLKKKGEGNG